MLGIVSKIVNFIIRLVQPHWLWIPLRRWSCSFIQMYVPPNLLSMQQESLEYFFRSLYHPMWIGSKHRWCFFRYNLCPLWVLPESFWDFTPDHINSTVFFSHMSSHQALWPTELIEATLGKERFIVGIKVSFASISATERINKTKKKKKE